MLIMKEQEVNYDRFREFPVCCDELGVLYKQELMNLLHECESFIKQHPNLQSQPVLSVIGREYKENYHSLLIKYIWEHANGDQILYHFLKSAGVEGDWIESVLHQQYKIETEHVIIRQRYKSWNGKRIDLLVYDDVNKWLVIIENKLLSSVRYSTESKTQLDIYYSYCENNRRWDGYNKAYVLLDYKDENTDDRWVSANYRHLFSSLLDNCPEDNVADEYLRTLFSILSPLTYGDDVRKLSETRLFYKEIIA